MATTSTIERLDSLAAELATKLRMPSSSPTTSSSSSSPSSYFQIKEEVEKLHRTMVRIRALLIDAEEREIRENHIKLWLDELRDAAYDAEDVVEEFEYELLRYQLVCEEEEDDQATHEDRGVNRRSQVSDSHNKTPCRALHDALFQQQILDKIKEINKRLHEIHEDRYALKLRKKDGKSKKQQNAIERPPTSSVLGDSHVYGRDKDEDEVVDMLLSPQSLEHGTENVSVVSIIGMGGIGKTTLAQLVYNDGRVEKHFEMRLWVCVSDCFDVVKLTKDILEAITGKRTKLRGFNQLQEKLQGNLKGKRFLLVLDDLWNENWEQWESLWRPLSSGAEGSKVLVTTRNEEVSKISRAVRSHHLKVLPNIACWSLFARCAFGRKNPDDHPNLMSIGRQIVQKCGGIPLAIRTLGGLLSNETDEDNWNDILNSDIWELPEKKNYILPALKLSYHHLPSPIKPCFAVCAVFPKDYWFKREEMVFFWMAQGYITPRGRKSMEDVGLEYLDELLQRSFFHTYNYYGGDFKMHDLIHDLALSIWGNDCLTVEDGKVPDSSRRARHVLFKREAGVSALVRRSTDKFRYLRTFYFPSTAAYVFFTKLLDDIFQNMKYLRVLNLGNIVLIELPDSIGNLKHLRYLTIRGEVDFTGLPESLCDLLNLQTLQVQGVHYLKELPKRLKVLVNLRHLDLPHCRALSMMPRGIGRLTQLRTLTRFVVGEGIYAAGIGELKHLNDLQGKLTVDIRSVNNWWVNREPNILSNTRGLEALNLEWNDHFSNTFGVESGFTSITQHEQRHEESLELIQPHTNIKELHLSGYIGKRLPKWMGDPSYLRLETISLSGFGNCTHLAALGQLPSLKSLEVSSMPAVRILDHEFFGSGMVVHGASPFPSLEVLSFSKLDILVEFYCVGTEEGSAFPRLQALKIANCDKLKYVKLRHLSSLRTLFIKRCRKLTTLNYCYDIHASVSRSGSSSWLQRRAIHHMHIPRVHTMDLRRCPKLDFLPVEPQLQLPSSLRRFSLHGSPLLREWVGRRVGKLVGVTNIFVGEYEVADVWRPHLVLRNVEDVEEAEAADLRRMQKSIRWLELRWDLDQHRSSSSSRPEEAAEQVLGELSPRPGSQLQELVIEGYQGRRFPNWVGHPDHLPNLRVLIIRNCPHLRTIQFQVLPEYGAPFRPSSSSSNSLSMTSLPLLKSLLIDDCPELVSFTGMRGTPSLRCLFLRRCPVLDFTHEAQLPPMLEYAEITGCPLLSGWCQGDHIAHLRELRVDGELVFSDGTNVDVDAMREICEIENMIDEY